MARLPIGIHDRDDPDYNQLPIVFGHKKRPIEKELNNGPGLV